MNARAALASTLLALASCSRPPASVPPELRLGREECDECGMLIHEDRSAAAHLITRDGFREHRFYDDIGCLLDAERGGLEPREILERWVHDHATRDWLDAKNATFVLAEPSRLETPMGSGIAAFAHAQRAREFAGPLAARVLTLGELSQARQDSMEQRFGKPRPIEASPRPTPDP